MKECKILQFWGAASRDVDEFGVRVTDHPDAEKVLEKYVNEGFVVKNMTDGSGSGNYAFYLEREV